MPENEAFYQYFLTAIAFTQQKIKLASFQFGERFKPHQTSNFPLREHAIFSKQLQLFKKILFYTIFIYMYYVFKKIM